MSLRAQRSNPVVKSFPHGIASAYGLAMTSSDNLMTIMTFSQIKDLLPRAVNRLNLQKPFRGSEVCHICRELIQQKFGEVGLVNIRPVSFDKQVLKIAVAHSGWAQEVQLISEWLMIEINRRMKEHCAHVERLYVMSEGKPTANEG